MTTTPLDVARGRIFGKVSEAAAIVRCDPRSLRHGIEAGTIPAVRVSDNTVRIPWVPFLRDVCGLDDVALSQLDLPGYSASPGGPAPEMPEPDSSTESGTATVHVLATKIGDRRASECAPARID